MKYLLGLDVGSSSVKGALVQIDTGKIVASAFSPSVEMTIDAPKAGFAEQDPEKWWQEVKNVNAQLKSIIPFKPEEIAAIGISYQMHGLVCVDKDGEVLRPAIIWCDSRAVTYGDAAFADMGNEYCLSSFLNSPGNFTASKLKWVKENEPAIYDKIYKIMLPGDYIAYKLSGDMTTTVTGLSEGIFWNFKEEKIADSLLKYYEIDKNKLSDVVPTYGLQARVNEKSEIELGIAAGTPISFRAGDQPNNACSLNVLNPGEIAATAGTSGVVYGVTDQVVYDEDSRVNTFVHVNHTEADPRYGVLLCINGTGILNSWVRKNFFDGASYQYLNEAAASVAPGSKGLLLYPFGNGAERVLKNQDAGASIRNINFNIHSKADIARAAQEGIVFSLNYGVEIMKQMGLQINTVRAGYANMFLSDLFAEVFANTTGTVVELYNTDGAAGAARAAGVGAGIYKNAKESYTGMELIKSIEPDQKLSTVYQNIYQQWKQKI
ncbi:xylulokinase [Gynurincola endophyticus]|uniref:xylulokinase n=1 Tax=Gynurincola endophyticus TaxID=2479004 RepID=UPI000F8E4593|nr:FGGY family carbohydrate kinase [Gynurincola endophyticus]